MYEFGRCDKEFLRRTVLFGMNGSVSPQKGLFRSTSISRLIVCVKRSILSVEVAG